MRHHICARGFILLLMTGVYAKKGTRMSTTRLSLNFSSPRMYFLDEPLLPFRVTLF